MIRLANEQDFCREITDECELRICALKQAYGLNAPFLRFFTDDQGSLASIMDGFCVYHGVGQPNEEWLSFLRMHPDIRAIHASGEHADVMKEHFDAKSVLRGEVLGINNVSSNTPLHLETPSITALYAFLTDNFETFPPFEQWYVDVSHRVRHGCCHIAAIQRDGNIISSAMSVAETPRIALIGGVATSPSHRGEGLATKCIADLLGVLPQATVLINPVNEYAAKLYKKIGFSTYGTWVELVLQ